MGGTDGAEQVTPDFKKAMVLVVVVAVNMTIIHIEITFEIMPVGHLLEFLVVGKEPADCVVFFSLGRRLCIEAFKTAKQN